MVVRTRARTSRPQSGGMVRVVYDQRLLRGLSRSLKQADKHVRTEIYKAQNRAIRPLRAAVKAEALTRLPKRGGLASRVASSRIVVRRRLAGRNPRVTIAVTGNPVQQVRRLDLGTVRHPVYGNPEVWVTQRVRPGWWSDPLTEQAPQIRREFIEAIAAFNRKVGKGR